jgi:CBS domain-containing protein
MDSPDFSRSDHAMQREAISSTAVRLQSALGRYVEAILVDEPPLTGSADQPRLTFPPLTVSDVMSAAVVSAYLAAPFKEIAGALDRNGINSVPVIDECHRVLGVVTASDLLARVGHVRPVPRGHRFTNRSETYRKEHATTAKDLMTSPAITASPSTSIAEAARMLARYRVRGLPVVDRAGVLVGMVSRGDLIKLFLRSDEEIANDVLRDVVRDEAVPKHSGVRVTVEEGVVTLAGRVDTAITARGLAYEAARVPGVVDVLDAIEFEVNDIYLPLSH